MAGAFSGSAVAHEVEPGRLAAEINVNVSRDPAALFAGVLRYPDDRPEEPER